MSTPLPENGNRETQVLKQTIQEYQDRYTTDDQKVEYQYVEIVRYQNINFILTCIYYFLVILMAFVLYYTMIRIHYLARWALWVAVATFPFWIGWVEFVIAGILGYLSYYASGQTLRFDTVNGNPPGVSNTW